MVFFQGSKKRALFAFLHNPSNNPTRTGIIYCHPFGEEQNASHFAIARAARKVASHGMPVLRFDLSGCGDSEGGLDEVAISDWLMDIESAIDVLKRETGIEKIIMWGLRFGAGLVLLYMMNKKRDVVSIILWHPVINFKEYIYYFLFRKITSETKVESVAQLVSILSEKGVLYVNGYPITNKLYKEFIANGSMIASYTPECSTFLLSNSSVERIPFYLKKYIGKLKNSGCYFGYKHIVSEPIWERFLQRECSDATMATIKWIESVVAGEQ